MGSSAFKRWSFVICFAAFSFPATAADDQLVSAAKKEGELTWYTTQIVNQFARPAAAAFQKLYGIKVNFVRGDSDTVALRAINESRAGHRIADVIDGTSVIPSLETDGLLLKWLPDVVSGFPKGSFDPRGYWVATNEYFQTPAYNTSLVPKGTEPRTYEALLSPKWKGKMAWASHGSTSGAAGFVGTVLTAMGQKNGMSYLRKLAGQSIAPLDGSSRSVVDQVVSGEYSIALQVFNHQAVISAAEGAPVDWIPMSPSMGIYSVTAIMKDAPHPASAKLFESFLVSKAGQRIFRDEDYIPVDPNIPPKVATLRPTAGSFKAIFFSPEQISNSISGWTKIYEAIFEK